MLLLCVFLASAGCVVSSTSFSCLDNLVNEVAELDEAIEFVFSDEPNFSDDIAIEKHRWLKELNEIEGYEHAMAYLDRVEKLLYQINLTDTNSVAKTESFDSGMEILSNSQNSVIDLTCVTPRYSSNLIEWFVVDNYSTPPTNVKTTVWYMIPRRDEHKMSFLVNRSVDIIAGFYHGDKDDYSLSGWKVTLDVTTSGDNHLFVSKWLETVMDFVMGSKYDSHYNWYSWVDTKMTELETLQTSLPAFHKASEMVEFMDRINESCHHIVEHKTNDDYLYRDPENQTDTLYLKPGSKLSIRCGEEYFVRYVRNLGGEHEQYLYSFSLNRAHPWFQFTSRDHFVSVVGLNQRTIFKAFIIETSSSFVTDSVTYNQCEIRVDAIHFRPTVIIVVMCFFVILLGVLGYLYLRQRNKAINTVHFQTLNEMVVIEEA